MKVFTDVFSIKVERRAQRSNEVIYSLLGVVLGELDRLPIPRGQEPTEDQIYTVIKKMYESAKEMKGYSSESEQEYEYLKDYIKVQLTEDEIKHIIMGLMVRSDVQFNMGMIMKYFKENYSGQYDGKVVSRFVKESM